MQPIFSEAELKTVFDNITQFRLNNHSPGVTRLAYSIEDEKAHHYLAEKARSLGLQIRQDCLGNLFFRLPGAEPTLPAVATGSHLDSVPQGGAYDGVVGVIAGLYALLQFKPKQLKRSLEVIVFRAEESSRFGFACMSSKVLTGVADPETWHKNKDSSGKNYFDVLTDQGYDVSSLTVNELSDNYLSAFIEVHIEQGKVLESQQKQIGIVTGIAAPTRFRVEVKGHADHSGATPMYQRSDALVASSNIISDLYNAAQSESYYNTVATVGKLDVIPNSINVIPGQVNFFVDIRGIEQPSITRVVERLIRTLDKTAADFNVSIETLRLANDKPVKLDDTICNIIDTVCQQHHIAAMRMISGAGHDAMYMAKKYPTAMIFIPSKGGISHHPDEYSEFDDILLASKILADSMAKLANQ